MQGSQWSRKHFFGCCLLVLAGVLSGMAQEPAQPTGLSGKIVFDPRDLAKASFDVNLDVSTVNTDNTMRDDHLKKETYFDVANYPRIRLVSTSVTAADKSGHYIMPEN